MGETGRIQLMHLCSTVFPTGMFSHSFGYERMLEDGFADTLEGFEEYLDGMLYMGLGKTDAALVRFSYEEPERWQEWDELCTALKPAVELRLASSKTGRAFLKVFHKMYPGNPLEEDDFPNSNYAVIFGLACRYLEIPLEETLEAYLTSTLLSYIQVGIKLIPLSQIEGQVLMRDFYPRIKDCVKNAQKAKEEDIFSFTPMVDIASMEHETQYSRMYMS